MRHIGTILAVAFVLGWLAFGIAYINFPGAF